MKNVLSITDLSANETKSIVNTAIELKTNPGDFGLNFTSMAYKSMAMIFDKPSLRTRLSFEVGMTQLGGHAIYLAEADIKLGVRESVEDVAIVTSTMADVIVARLSSHKLLEELAENSSVPVVNAMSDLEHPCQALADCLTIYEEFGAFEGIKIAYLGDANNNVTNSLALVAELLEMKLHIASPSGYEISQEIAGQSKSLVQCDDPEQAVKAANVVVTDTWISAGKEGERAKRLHDLSSFQVNQELMELADEDAIFMHCLPAYRGQEVTAEVIDGPQSAVFVEAENRLHAQKALLLHIMS